MEKENGPPETRGEGVRGGGGGVRGTVGRGSGDRLSGGRVMGGRPGDLCWFFSASKGPPV